MLEDLELLFQEQLTALAEDAAKQQAMKKGKVVVTDPCHQQDHPSIMVLEESEATPTRLVELITPQPGGGSRWYVQPKPHLKHGGGQKKNTDLGLGRDPSGSSRISQQ